jgi:predicted TIM-barrel fold metal-dependent hydrolase
MALHDRVQRGSWGWLLGLVVLAIPPANAAELTWRADHHLHLASPGLCKLVGECLPTHDPPAVYAADAVRALDDSGIAKGVVLSCAYLYGLADLKLPGREIAAQVREENEFTASEVRRYPGRLVGFLSVDPLQPSAEDEIRHWAGSRELVGVKIHFSASAVNLRDAGQRAQVANVLTAAAAQHMPIVVHIGGGAFDGNDAEVFIREVLPHAGESMVQIAHAGGGLPRLRDHQVEVMRAFADHMARDDPATRRVLFDVSYVPAPDESAASRARLLRQMRKIGLARFVFGSDFNVLTPRQEIENLRLLGLSAEEWQALERRCAPWAC